MKKLLLVAAVAGGAYLVYRQVMASRAEDDLWSEATKAPDFTADYPSAEPEPAEPAAEEEQA